MKRYAGSIALVVCAAVLGLYVWLDRNHVTTGEQKARENDVFPVWRKDELRDVMIVHEGETLHLAKDAAGTWRMHAPHEERADQAAVDRLLGTLEYAPIARRASETKELGFEAPRATGALMMGGLTLRFVLGAPSPQPEGSAYLKVDDGPPLVVARELASALLEGSDVFRDRTVVPYLATELSRFEVRAAHGFLLERIDERSLKVNGVLAARSVVDGMWASLAEMRAESFPKDGDADRLTANPVLTIILTPKDGRPPSEIVIGDACPGHADDVVVLRKTPTRIAACAPKGIVPRLLPDEDVLLEKRPFTMRMDEIEELRLERVAPGPLPGAGAAAPAAIEIARKGTGFHERAPDDRELSAAEADAATDVLTRLGTTAAEDVKRAAGAGAGTFTAVARARVIGGEHDEVVELAAPDAKGHVMLRRLLDDARLDAGPVLARLLAARTTTLRPHTIVDGEERRPSRVVLRCGVDQELVDRGAGFRMITPRGYDADGTVAQLADAIVKGRVDPWISDIDDGTFGFTPNGCRVILGFEDEKAPITVSFGAAGEGGVYGRIDTRDGVFVAPQALRDLAGRIYVSRAALRIPAAQIESVHLTRGGAPLELPNETLRALASSLVGDRVVALGKTSLPPADLVIDVALTEGGPPRRIACGGVGVGVSAAPKERLCTVTGVDATFGVADFRFATLERDGGAR